MGVDSKGEYSKGEYSKGELQFAPTPTPTPTSPTDSIDSTDPIEIKENTTYYEIQRISTRTSFYQPFENKKE